jgi:hypothetical protein
MLTHPLKRGERIRHHLLRCNLRIGGPAILGLDSQHTSECRKANQYSPAHCLTLVVEIGQINIAPPGRSVFTSIRPIGGGDAADE